MLMRLIGLMGLTLAVGAPAFAQTVGEVCEARKREFREAAVAVSQQAANVAAALEVRAALAPQEAAAREKCSAGGYYATAAIDVTKEDLDIALARHVLACNAFIAQASPYVSTAPQGRGDPAKAKVMAETLFRLRGEAEQPCKDYPGVMGRMYRAELLLQSFQPPPPVQRGKPE